MSTKIPTKIVDKNGKLTTVHRNAESTKSARSLPQQAAPSVEDGRPLEELSVEELNERVATLRAQAEALRAKPDIYAIRRQNIDKARVIEREVFELNKLVAPAFKRKVAETGYAWHTPADSEDFVGIEVNDTGGIDLSFVGWLEDGQEYEWGERIEKFSISNEAERNLLAYLDSEFPADGERGGTYRQYYPFDEVRLSEDTARVDELKGRIAALKKIGRRASGYEERVEEIRRLNTKFEELLYAVQAERFAKSRPGRNDTDYTSLDSSGFGAARTIDIGKYGSSHLFTASEWGEFKSEALVSADDARALRDFLKTRSK